MASNAVPQNYVSTVLGYDLIKGYLNSTSQNLLQNISVFAEASTGNQSGLSLTPQLVTSRAQAAALYGWGSPIDQILRILFPVSGTGVPVPVTVYPQAAAVASVAKVITITPTGTATAAGTIFLMINGREVVDGASYAVNIAVGDTPTVQCDKMRAAVAASLGCPILGTGTATFIATTKWTGQTANDVNIVVDLNGATTGTTYAVVNTTAGAGTPTVTSSLTSFGNAWNTLIINSYGLIVTTMQEFEAYNGTPDAGTGLYSATSWRPFLALSGTTLDDPTSITGASGRKTNVTIVACPAPLSLGMPYEAAANMAYLLAGVMQDTPHLDIINKVYPDMPPPPAGSIPAMNTYTVRQAYVTNGCSTVDFTGGVYKIKDVITTYVPVGEIPPFYRWVRDMNVYFNYKFGYRLKEVQNLVGKTLVDDGAVTTVDGVMKPKVWRGIVEAYNLDCEKRALIVNAAVNNKTIVVNIGASNPNRMETTENIQISGIARVLSTTVTGGFNFG